MNTLSQDDAELLRSVLGQDEESLVRKLGEMSSLAGTTLEPSVALSRGRQWLEDNLDDLSAFEHLADCYATIWAIKFECVARATQGDEFSRLRTDGFRLWGFAVCTLFHLFEAFEEAPQTGAERSHPRAALRSILVNAAISGGPSTYGDIPASHILGEISRGFDEAHTAWSDVGWGPRAEISSSEVDLALTDVSNTEQALGSV